MPVQKCTYLSLNFAMDINNEDDDEPAANDAVVFVYDGVNDVPYDVTHVRVLPTVTVIHICY